MAIPGLHKLLAIKQERYQARECRFAEVCRVPARGGLDKCRVCDKSLRRSIRKGFLPILPTLPIELNP
ncbi:hypothetical protein BJL95_09580 [Methylomonas sp. LWB]|nr:hypothetical protein BJL95_09580 [Methylomonas sp. LWB]